MYVKDYLDAIESDDDVMREFVHEHRVMLETLLSDFVDRYSEDVSGVLVTEQSSPADDIGGTPVAGSYGYDAAAESVALRAEELVEPKRPGDAGGYSAQVEPPSDAQLQPPFDES